MLSTADAFAAAADTCGCGLPAFMKGDPSKVIMAAKRPDERECGREDSNL